MDFPGTLSKVTLRLALMGGRSAAEILPEFGGGHPRSPVPIGGPQVRPGTGCHCLFGNPHKAQARRHHQPLLAGGDQHIDAPGIHLQPVAAQRCYRIHRQQRRMAGGIHRSTDRRNVVAQGGAGVDMGHQHRLDPVAGVRRQRHGDAHRIDRLLAWKHQLLHIDTQASGGIGPVLP